MLEISHVSKRYRKDVWGLRDFSLTLGPGVLGLLGPNNRKSTLMRILATIAQPTEGEVRWKGAAVANHANGLRAVLGYLPQDFGVYPQLSAVEFLQFLAAAKGLNHREARLRIDALLNVVNLTDSGNRPVGGFSGGMKQRVGIAAALLNDPELLIVDEPTAGLDPEERVRFRNLLAVLSGERLIILSSHIVSDVEAAATEIAIINAGRLVAHGSPEWLLQSVVGKVWECVVPSSALVEKRKGWLISNSTRRSDGVRLRVVAEQSPDPSATPAIPNLEDAYLYQLAGSRGAAVA